VSEFTARVDAFVEGLFVLDPIFATHTGNHEFDDRWPDLSAAGRERRLRFAAEWTAAFSSFSDGDLTADERVDRDLLLGLLAASEFDDTVLREEAWSPLWWVYLIGEGLFGLLAREFAPFATRLASLAARAEKLPALLDAARETLVGVEGRPVDAFHAETALAQWPGLISIVDDAIETSQAAEAAGDRDVAAILPRLRAARQVAGAALDAFAEHLRAVVLPVAEGEGRLGPELFAAKMAHTMRDASMTPDYIRDHAEREYAAVGAEMVRIARAIAPRWLGDAPIPDDDAEVVRAVLDRIAVEHPAPDAMLEYCRTELRRIEAFCRDRSLITLADEPLAIEWTPVFLRALSGAMLSSPGVLEAGQKAMFLITPVADDATPEQAESKLREDNDRMLRLLTIHEAVPGHYLQGVYANRVSSKARTIFESGVYAEGWAVYVTQVMMDAGYAADDPALLLCHWKFYLRSAINARIDVGIHTAGMTEAEAVGMMVDGGFQEEAEARAKYNRARLSSTQLSTYFVGSVAFWELEAEVRRRAAQAAGAPADAVPSPRVVGGYPETPGFERRRHLESVLSHGSPPIPLLRRLVLGD
jgi:uncharacterized protein (DUF885 family)